MEAFLIEWGLEILFGLISAGVIGWAKWNGEKLKKELDTAKQLTKEKEQNAITTSITSSIEVQLEPIYEELEDLRKYIRETENIEKTHMSLIVASYRFRLIQLCKGFLRQGYITPAQIEQLTEFYKLYTGLGGNGQAKVFYEMALQLPRHFEEEEKENQ